MRQLLQVEDVFELNGRGLVLAPDIPFPSKGFAPFEALVTVIDPTGISRVAEASFSLTHFRPGGYKLLVTLPHEEKDRVPIGSVIHADEQVHSRIGPPEA